VRDDSIRIRKLVVADLGSGSCESLQVALISFIYNVGEGAYRRSTLRKYLLKKDLAQVMKQLSRWVIAEGKVSQGLVKRRGAEAALIKECI
jgi:GH24 family phage-related lysozyme (muramidase)